jgi:phytoene synthase
VRIASDSELDRYMDGSAATVGRIMAPLLGAPPGEHEQVARLGVAFQLTNFIRDVREDWALDRLYLPREDLQRFGVGERDLARGEATEAFRALLADEVRWARSLFATSAVAVEAATPRARPAMRLARSVYLGVLDRVERIGFDVLRHRTGLAPWEMGRAALSSLRAA